MFNRTIYRFSLCCLMTLPKHMTQELVNTQELPSLLESTLQKLKQVSERYSSKSALGKCSADGLDFCWWEWLINDSLSSPAAEYPHVSQQVKQLEEDTTTVLKEVNTAKSSMGRILSAWDSYGDCLSSLQAWLEQGTISNSLGQRAEVLSTHRYEK